MNLRICPKVGDYVCFTPTERTVRQYQDVERFGVRVGHVYKILEIRDGVYLYFKGGIGGWPYDEFSRAQKPRKGQ